MHYGDTLKLLATNGDENRRFLFTRSAGATSSGYKLYGYDPDENARNFLEDFGIGGNPNHQQEIEEARRRIQFYVGEDWEIEAAQTA
ncbi:hypothetical protein [Halosimplex pelagicum]|uniref:Uncharacterized protein n=1 Tax=Halosimplex pelagicum TaxID=869886 RepID=A0A7D5PF31_9EURY|nr:hypothetical protein [Halosimplex pelagicum]QLH82299.1 hypothetical protein HZS54_12050 [Halosimplex pelagicum]